PDLARHGLLDPRLAVVGAGGLRGLYRAARDLLEIRLAHAAVPPTVSAWMRTCGCPTPAATRCPPLPQKPVAISRSAATPSISLSASSPLPISVAPRTGEVTFPFSIR